MSDYIIDKVLIDEGVHSLWYHRSGSRRIQVCEMSVNLPPVCVEPTSVSDEDAMDDYKQAQHWGKQP